MGRWMAVCSKAPGPPTGLETEPEINLLVEGNGSKDSGRNCTEGRIFGTISDLVVISASCVADLCPEAAKGTPDGLALCPLQGSGQGSLSFPRNQTTSPRLKE